MSGQNVLEINELNFEEQVLAADRPFLLELSAAWCAPCKAMAGSISRLADERLGALHVGVLDVEQSPGVASRLGVRGMPTLLLFANGAEVKRQLGALSLDKLRAMVSP